MKARTGVVAVALVGLMLLSCTAWGYGDADNKKVERILIETVVSFNFQDQPVEQVAEYLSTLGNINVVLDRAKIQPGQTVTLKLNNVSLETALKLVTEAIAMKYVIRDGVVLISDAEGTKQVPITRVYDVLDLVAEIPDFEGPDFSLGTTTTNNGGTNTGFGGGAPLWGGGGGGGGTGTGGQAGQGKTLEERTQELVDMIKQVIAPGTWDTGGY